MKSLIPVLLLVLFACSAARAEEPVQKEVWQAQRAQAELMRKEAKASRDQAETVRERDDQACLQKLLVNSCQERSRERYLAVLKLAREKEIEASRLDTEAKAALLKLNALEHEARIQAEAAKSAAKPEPKAKPESKLPPPAPSAASVAQQEATKAKGRQDAQTRRTQAAAEASVRAQKKREDAARYDARAKLIAERKARRAGETSGASNAFKP